MPNKVRNPTTAKFWLGTHMRRLREARNLTQQAAAKLAGIGANSLSNYELARNLIKVNDARVLFGDVYQVSDEHLEAVLEMVRIGHRRGVHNGFKGVIKAWLQVLAALEDDCSRLQEWQPSIVPGYMQTEAYARAVLSAGRFKPAEVDNQVKARLARADTIFGRKEPLDCWVILHETVLDCVVGGPAVMAEQLGHLLTLAERVDVTIQVLPHAVGAHAAMGSSFAALTFQQHEYFADFSIVYHDWPTGSVYLDEPDEVEEYLRKIRDLIKDSLPGPESLGRIAKAKDLYEQRVREVR